MRWFARYNLGEFDAATSDVPGFDGQTFIHPYFWYGSADGGPGACDQGNSDGFDTMEWKIWVR